MAGRRTFAVYAGPVTLQVTTYEVGLYARFGTQRLSGTRDPENEASYPLDQGGTERRPRELNPDFLSWAGCQVDLRALARA